jgi:hypothetical protein
MTADFAYTALDPDEAQVSDRGFEQPQTGSRVPDFCERTGADSVRDIFCGTTEVSVRGVANVISLLQLDATPRSVVLSPGVAAGAAVYDRA